MSDPRVSGHLGNPIDLNVTFYQNGAPKDPYAIRQIQIFKSSVQDENLIAEFPMLSPLESGYPAPLTRETDSNGIKPGIFHLIWDVPEEGIATPDIFFDVWSYIPNDVTEGLTDPDEALDNEDLWQSCCNEFWLFPDSFYCDSGLFTIELAFEAMDIKFNKPECRTLRVGITPLPLYDFNFNRVAPIIPHLKSFISIRTTCKEMLVDRESVKIGLREGSYRNNPFLLQYKLDTRKFLKGSYEYQIELCLPNGETRASPWFIMQIQ